MPNVDWYIEGIEFGNCVCDYSCPCQFEALPTHGHCRGFEAVDIERGHFGDTDLTGLRCVITYAWPGPIFEGKGEYQVFIDERADEAQRAALDVVLHGGETEEAATHWWIFHEMCDTVHPTIYAPIEFEVDVEARKGRVEVPGVLKSVGRPIRSPVDGSEHRVRIDLPHGIEFEIAEVGSASTTARGAIELILEDSFGQFNRLRHSGSGIVRQ
jgi:hypothetical protein